MIVLALIVAAWLAVGGAITLLYGLATGHPGSLLYGFLSVLTGLWIGHLATRHAERRTPDNVYSIRGNGRPDRDAA